MSSAFKHPLRAFTLLTFVVFWILFACTGLLVALHAPQLLQTIMKNVCAWSSTFVLLCWYPRFRPAESISSLLRRQFSRVGVLDFAVPMVMQIAIAALSLYIVLSLTGEALANLRFVQVAGIVPLIITNITSGPMGEELGWRGYALDELQKTHTLFVSSILVGVLWGLWHFPLWLVSGYQGLDLIAYSGSFLLGIISFSVFISFFYSRSRNILVAVWIHFLFNVLLQLALLSDIRLLLLTVSVLYLLVGAVLVLSHRELFFDRGRSSAGSPLASRT